MGIPLVAISLALMAAVGTANAGTGNPKTIAVTQAGPMSVNASGTWSWPEMVTATKMSYGGFAIDWGDLTSGNAVGSYHIGDGTAATDIVMQTSPAQGSSGSWGPVSHTYAAAGTNKVCVILYDLGEVKPFKATGYHSLLAGGTDRNTDNSVDNGNETPAMCQTIDVTAPVPTAFQSFQGETATPFQSLQGATSQPTTQGTPPSTSTSGDPTSPNQGAPMLPLVLLIGTGLASIAVFKMERVRR
jgi:hypothetical protein